MNSNLIYNYYSLTIPYTIHIQTILCIPLQLLSHLSLSLHICKLCLTNKQVHEDYGITHKHSFPISRNDANKQVGYTFEKEQGNRK